MSDLLICCSYCRKQIVRRRGWVKENIKLTQKNYCSFKCLGDSRKSRVVIKCENPLCVRTFERTKSNISPHNYCSRSCMMTVNNTKFPKRQALIKTCLQCGQQFKGSAIKYCSAKCQSQGATVSGDKLLNLIKNFYKRNGRIPIKSEFPHYHAVRGRFGTWNNAIKAAGFEPNPVMFAKKYTARDGHKCDSLAEMIIDDWLFDRDILHKRSYPYPGNLGFRVDFLIGDYWVEFFGLAGQHRRYDELKELKTNLATKHQLNLIELYPEHLFPKNKLDDVLHTLIN